MNDLNGFSRVVVMDEVPEPTQPVAVGPGVGFVVERSSARVYATDASGARIWDQQAEAGAARAKVQAGEKPKTLLGAMFGSAPSPAATTAQARRLVQTLRSQLALYALQHHDRYPNLSEFPEWQQLVKRTDPLGIPGPKGKYGPYVEVKPVNPLTGTWRAQVVIEHPGPGFRTEPGVAWVYHQESGKIWAADGKGGMLDP